MLPTENDPKLSGKCAIFRTLCGWVPHNNVMKMTFRTTRMLRTVLRVAGNYSSHLLL